MRTSESTFVIQIFPSPIFPDRAAAMIVSATTAAFLSSVTTSMRIFGRKSTLYSAPRKTSVWPRWRPWPRTSVSVMPSMSIAWSASVTGWTMWGLTTAVTSFIRRPSYSLLALTGVPEL